MFSQFSFTDIDSIVASLYEGRRVQLIPYAMIFDFDSTTEAGSNTPIVTAYERVLANADFIACSLSYGNSENTNLGLADEINIKDSGTKETLFNDFIPIQDVCSGPAFASNASAISLCRGLPFPRRFAALSSLECQIQTTVTTGFPRTQIVMDGVSVYVLD